jgi:hypothetical protein
MIQGDPFADDEPADLEPSQPPAATDEQVNAEAIEKELEAALSHETTFEGVKAVGERFADRIKSTGDGERFRSLYFKHTKRIRDSLEKSK